MEITYVYTKKRSEFGRQCNFTDRPAELLADIIPENNLRKQFIDRNPCDLALQCSNDYSEHEVNTERFESENRGVNHTEGGWPKDVNPAEVEQTIRFRKKVEKDEAYMQTIQNLGREMERFIKQNNAVDIYGDYFADVKHTIGHETSAKTVNIMRDPNDIKRSVSHISWYPDGAQKLAAAYSILEFQRSPVGMNPNSFVWDISNPNTPETVLKSSSPMLCIEYNPKDPHLLVGGYYNGQLALFDTRKGSYPTDVTPVEWSHKDPIHKIIFPSSKTGSDVFSASTDGFVYLWDIRKLVDPVESWFLQPKDSELKLGGISLDFESTMPTKFMVGTEQGQILLCNRKAKTPQDKITASFSGSLGPIYALQRNPFYPKQFLSVSDWMARVWSEDAKESAIMWTKYCNVELTDGCWSPTRPAVYFVTKMNGCIDLWDICFKQNDPALSIQVCDDALVSIRAHSNGSLVAVGSQQGTITVLELSSGFSQLQSNEKTIVNAVRNLLHVNYCHTNVHISVIAYLTYPHTSVLDEIVDKVRELDI
jgi:dynein intermediate chain 2